MRKAARECAMKLIYEFQFSHCRNEDTLATLCEKYQLDEKDVAYLNGVYNGVMEKEEELREEIFSHSVNYKSERIFLLDLSIMILALYEMKYCEDVPPKVALNEAIELAKKYSTDKSGSLINGILANYL